MDWDDVVYLSLLLFSIGFGYFYKQIKDPQQKKLVGTGIGILIVFIVSGIHIIHPVVCTLINTGIILLLPKRICHLVSFVFTFGYLIFFRTTTYFGIPYPPAHTNLVQMMLTLKLIGLAFEVNTADSAKKANDEKLSKEEINYLQVEPCFIDIFHYTFNYAGVLTGPYYKYRTFLDFINKPYSRYADCKQATIDKLKWIPLFAVLFLLITNVYPIHYSRTDEFYERSFLYRYWYVTPTFAWFRMRIYIGLTLSECVCTMAGLGAYPKAFLSKSGNGPTKIDAIKQLNEKNLEKIEYDFNTIYNINPYGSDFCVTFREGMKHWNMCIQYWLAVNIYKRFPSKQLRTFATTFVSALWHGVYLGYYYCIVGVPFYLLVEDQYMNVFRKNATGMRAKIWDFIIWIAKMQGFAYLGFAFHLLTFEKVLKYYNSVYHMGEISFVILYIIAYLYKQNKPRTKKE